MTQAEELSIKAGPDSTSPKQTRHQPPNCQHKSFHNEKLPGKPHKTFTVNSINWISNMVAGLEKPGATCHPPPLPTISAHTEVGHSSSDRDAAPPFPKLASPCSPHAGHTARAAQARRMEEPQWETLHTVLSHSRRVEIQPSDPLKHTQVLQGLSSLMLVRAPHLPFLCPIPLAHQETS